MGNETPNTVADRNPPEGGETPPPAGGGGGQTPDSSRGQAFTQADIDRIVGERLARERAKLGEQYKDYDDLKKAADELKKLQDEKLSEQEKQTKKLAEAEAKAKELESKLQAQAQATNARLIRAEVRVQAAALGFTSPDDAHALADLSAVKIDDEGKVTGVEDALKKLAKDKPYLLGTQNGGDRVGTPPRGGQPRQPVQPDKKPAPAPIIRL